MKLRTGTEKEIKTILETFAYESSHCVYYYRIIEEFLNKDCKANKFGEVVL